MIHYITSNGVGNAWVGNELRLVSRAGVPFALHSMREPEQTYFVSEWAEELNRRTKVLYPLPLARMAVSLLLAPLLFCQRFFAALANALLGERETPRARLASIAHFFVACHWARTLRKRDVSLIHSQWAHSCGTIGMYAAWLLDVPFSFTGHAADLFRDRAALRDKIRRADFIICISTFHRSFYKQNGARDEQLHIAYCGIDVDHFAPKPRVGQRGDEPRILASGRLVGKKGFVHLVDACRLLVDRGFSFDCTIAGSGPLESELRARVRQLGLADRVHLTGEPLKQEEIPSFMHSGDIFCLPCVWSKDNDVDGLPQMLMEAMACGLPAVSTRLVGIPDLIVDGETGLLVEPGNVEQLADAIQTLIEDTDLASRLAGAGRQRVIDVFDIDSSLEPLIRLFRARLAADTGAPPCESASSAPTEGHEVAAR